MDKNDKQTIACHISTIMENLSIISKIMDTYVTDDKQHEIADSLMERVYIRLEEIEDTLDLWNRPSLDLGQFDSIPYHYDTMCNCDSCNCRRDSYDHRMD